jgi:ribosome-binding factor A
MSPAGPRAQRVGHLIQQELAKMLVEGVKDPRVGFATVTEVRASPDLRTARVYFSVYGSDQERSDTMAGLTAASGYLQRELGRRLRLKYTPELTFALDTSLDQADRLEQLIGAISRGETETPADLPRESVPVETSRSELAGAAKSFAAQPATRGERPRRGKRSRKRRRRS